MATRGSVRRKWTAAERARHKAIREEFAHRPSQEELQASGDYEGPIKAGAYFAVKALLHELKTARETSGLTLASVARTTGMDQATLSRLENGRQPNPTVDTLWRYAHALGKQLVLTCAEPTADRSLNGKAARTESRKRPRRNSLPKGIR